MLRVVVPLFGGGNHLISTNASPANHLTRKGGRKPRKAAVRHEFGDTDVLKCEEIQTPKPNPAHILIRILARASRNV